MAERQQKRRRAVARHRAEMRARAAVPLAPPAPRSGDLPRPDGVVPLDLPPDLLPARRPFDRFIYGGLGLGGGGLTGVLSPTRMVAESMMRAVIPEVIDLLSAQQALAEAGVVTEALRGRLEQQRADASDASED